MIPIAPASVTSLIVANFFMKRFSVPKSGRRVFAFPNRVSGNANTKLWYFQMFGIITEHFTTGLCDIDEVFDSNSSNFFVVKARFDTCGKS